MIFLWIFQRSDLVLSEYQICSHLYDFLNEHMRRIFNIFIHLICGYNEVELAEDLEVG